MALDGRLFVINRQRKLISVCMICWFSYAGCRVYLFGDPSQALTVVLGASLTDVLDW